MMFTFFCFFVPSAPECFTLTNTTFSNQSWLNATNCCEFTDCLFLELNRGNQSGGTLLLSGRNNSAFLRISVFVRCFAKTSGSSGGATYSSFEFLMAVNCCASDSELQFANFLRIVNCVRPLIGRTIEFNSRVVTGIVNDRVGIDWYVKVGQFLNRCNVTNCSAISVGVDFFLNGNEMNLLSVVLSHIICSFYCHWDIDCW
jgi:hypothetical protein